MNLPRTYRVSLASDGENCNQSSGNITLPIIFLIGIVLLEESKANCDRALTAWKNVELPFCSRIFHASIAILRIDIFFMYSLTIWLQRCCFHLVFGHNFSDFLFSF